MKRILFLFKKYWKITTILGGILLIWYYFCLPKKLFDTPTSTVIESSEGELLGAIIASDGQWRFPASDSIPEKFKTCIIQFEDEYFYKHPGFNPVSIFKAIKANLAEGQIVRGGSTITQQVIRLSRNGKQRTYLEKIKELILATRLEFRASKDTILNYYAANAPFGGNVVGLDVAAWRYFGVQPHQLSWAETATLAVLPNAPSLIYPGKNQTKLLNKRNSLLKKLLEKNIIDLVTYNLSIQEPLPQKPFPLPQIAPHLLQRVAKDYKGKRVRTSISYYTQQKVNEIVNRHHNTQKENEIYNMAVLILDINTRKVVSYIGNTNTSKEHQKDVDVVTAPRSTGSILKPLLYMAMLDKGELLPNTLVPDVPTVIADYQPENYNLKYSGAISAKKALARSLNIPAVRLLNQYGLDRFYEELKPFNLRHINKGVDHYGLSLILGGAESSLWDLCKTYAGLAATVNHYTQTSSEYYTKEFSEPSYLNAFNHSLGKRTTEKNIFDAGSIYLGLEAMLEVNRPEGDEAWKFYDSSKKIAWKTGTSFGNRDAWAIGASPNYVIGVWVGNADGEGRPNLTGVTSAAPVLFDVLNVLPNNSWFKKPYDELTEVTICSKSGYLASPLCEGITQWIPALGKRTKLCPYHERIHVDASQNYRVNASCEALENITTTSWFVLPPLMAWYYKRYHADYKPLPPLRNDCKQEIAPTMDFIFPKKGSRVILPKNETGAYNAVVFKIAHTKPETKVFWYLDDTFIKTTETFHEIAVLPAAGTHTITVVDALGNELVRDIIIER